MISLASRTHVDVEQIWRTAVIETLTGLFKLGCSEDPERPAIVSDDGVVITRRELLARCVQFAGFLCGRIRPGERVLAMLGDRSEFIVALFATASRRAVLVAVPAGADQADLRRIVQESTPSLAIVGNEQAKLMEELRADCPSLQETLVLEDPEPFGLDRFGSATQSSSVLETGGRPDELITVYYTIEAGTPRGCMLDHGWWLREVNNSLRLFRRGTQDRQLCCLPLQHTASVVLLMSSLLSRGTMIPLRARTLSGFWDAARNLDATEILSAPFLPALLSQGGNSLVERDHRIRAAFHPGPSSGMQQDLAARLGCDWLNSYRRIECGTLSQVPLHLASERIGGDCIGMALPGVEVRLVDESGNEVGTGCTGEALVRGPHLFRGYLGRSDLTEAVLQDGWFRTGDLLRRDERGLLYFVGRKAPR